MAAVVIDKNIMLPMRDGVHLATDVYRWATDELAPALFMRLPYDKESMGQLISPLYDSFRVVRAGYVVVVRDCGGGSPPKARSRRCGGNRPPVVLAHGGSNDGLSWTAIAQALEDDYELIMPDARAHGLSHAPQTPYGMADLAGDQAGLIQALGLQKPPIIGHSMGGATALTLAGLYPDVPGAVVLEDAGPFRMPAARSPEDEQRRERMCAEMAALKTKTREELIAAVRAEHPDWPEAELGPWVEAKLGLGLNVLNRDDAAPLDWQVVLPHITCPALLIAADPEHGAGVTVERATELQALILHPRIAHVPGAGHNIRRDQFARFIEVVRPFLDTWTGTFQTTSPS